MAEVCSACDGSGLCIVQEDNRNVARPCECRLAQRATRMLERARIPKRYEHCSLDSYESKFRGADKTLAAAHMRARKFVEGYPIESAGTGLLLTGSIGVGKTHLDRKSTRLNSSHLVISYAVFCLKKKARWKTHDIPDRLLSSNGALGGKGDRQARLRRSHAERQQHQDRGRRASSFFFNDTATTEIYPLSLHDALPICERVLRAARIQFPASGLLRPHRQQIIRSEEHTSELQSPCNLVCRLLLEKKNEKKYRAPHRSSARTCPTATI